MFNQTKKEKLSERFPLRLTPTEIKFVKKKAKEEFNSENGIIRKAINLLKND